jgi:alcohol dehydrogenase (cytochrome c)
LSINGNLANQRYVPVNQINPKTVAGLGAMWVSEPFADGATSRMTPLVHEGLMFLGAGPRIYALDARSGKMVWQHQLEARKPPAVNAITSAKVTALQTLGVANSRSWGLGLGGGMVFAGLTNGHVVALGEKSGDVVWDKLISDEPLAIGKRIMCPPLYVDGVLYVGLGLDVTEGHAIAVEATSGRVLWRISTVAKPDRSGHQTWPHESNIWRSGGAHPWVAPAADPSLGLVYFVTGNAGPPSAGKLRPGDNLYSVSLIALEMETGKLRWYRQLVRHDLWEADLSVSPVLFDKEIAGRRRQGVAVMRGDGYLFLFDRTNGEPLITIEERPVPQNPAVFTSATQPFPRDADSILPPCVSWSNKIPTGFILGCMFDPPSHDVPNRLAQWASVRVAPMSYSPQTGYFYAQGTNSLLWQGTADDPYVWITNVNGDRVPNYPAPTVVVAAVDSGTDKVIWRKELPSVEDSGYKSNGGALSTAGGLVFHQGGDGSLQAYDATTSETLWRFQTDFAAGDASPMSYAIDGRQYVAFVAGAKVWAFALGGKLPQASSPSLPPQEEVSGPIRDANEIETLTLEHADGIGERYRLNEFAFNPYRARIRAGTSVTFINNGYLPHTIVARDGSWSTGILSPGQIATIGFDKPGSYLYFSKEYPWSYGQIVVASVATIADAVSEAQKDSEASEQVAFGKTCYVASCSSCHGENLNGRDPAPALSGGGFRARWAGHDALTLFDRIRTTMPPTAPGALSDDNYAAIVSYILYSNENHMPFTLERQTMKGLPITHR